MNEYKNKVSIRNFKYMRFVFFRYALAFLFFINLYWALFIGLSKHWSVFIPLTSLILCAIAMIEQKRLYWEHTNHLPMTRNAFLLQIIINLFLFASVWHRDVFKTVFPFLILNNVVLTFMYILLLIGICISVLGLYKIKRINTNTDSKYQQIERYVELLDNNSRK